MHHLRQDPPLLPQRRRHPTLPGLLNEIGALHRLQTPLPRARPDICPDISRTVLRELLGSRPRGPQAVSAMRYRRKALPPRPLPPMRRRTPPAASAGLSERRIPSRARHKVAAALLDFNSRRTLLYLRKSATAKQLVSDLGAGTCDLTHEDFDARMSSPKDLSVDYLRSLLVSAGILPVRDEYLARLERWVEFKIATLDDPEDRRLITAFARWDRVVRIRRRARGKPISPAAVDVTQSQIGRAVTFLTWLKKHDATLATCHQTLIDLRLPRRTTKVPTLPAHSSPGPSAARTPPASASPTGPRDPSTGRSTPTTAGRSPANSSTTTPSKPGTALPDSWSFTMARHPPRSAD